MSELFSERLKSARILNGFSLQDLADKLENKVSRQALHKYEKGDVIPDETMMAQLSKVLNVKPDFFTREVKVEFTDKIEFRKLKSLPSKQVNQITEEVKDTLSRYLELEMILGIETKFLNPLNEEEITTFDQIEEAAKTLREKWKLGADPIYNVIELLEDNHIKVAALNAGDSFDGLQSWVNGDIPVIAVNRDKLKSSDRVRFTALHELCHLLTRMNKVSDKQKEKFCHQFAGAMLMPAETLIKEIGRSRSKLMIQELGALKKQYGISIQAIVIRAKDLGIISETYYKQFFFYLVQMGWKTQEPEVFNYEGFEESNRFIQLLFRAIAEDQISIEKAAALNNQTLAEFRQKYMIAIQ